MVKGFHGERPYRFEVKTAAFAWRYRVSLPSATQQAVTGCSPYQLLPSGREWRVIHRLTHVVAAEGVKP